MLVVNIVSYLFHTGIQRKCMLKIWPKISLAVVQIFSTEQQKQSKARATELLETPNVCEGK